MSCHAQTIPVEGLVEGLLGESTGGGDPRVGVASRVVTGSPAEIITAVPRGLYPIEAGPDPDLTQDCQGMSVECLPWFGSAVGQCLLRLLS